MKKKNTKIKKTQKILLSVLGILVVILIALFVGFKLKYADLYYTSTFVNGVEISHMNKQEANDAIRQMLDNQKLVISDDQKEKYEFSLKDDLAMTYDLDTFLKKVKDNEDDMNIISQLFSKKEYSVDNLKIDEEKLKKAIEKSDFYKNGLKDKTTNAKEEFDKETLKYVVKKEHQGTNIEVDHFIQTIDNSIGKGVFKIDLGTGDYYEKPTILSDNQDLNTKVDALNQFIGASITYKMPNTKVKCDASVYKDWLKYDKDKGVSLDSSQVKSYVQTLANKYNTYGKSRKFKTTKRGTITVSGGKLGYLMNQSKEVTKLTENIKKKETVTREPVYSQRELSTNNGFGGSYAEVDLTNQQVYCYKNGKLVLSSACVTGNPNKGNATPPGVFKIAYKQSPATLKGRIDPKTGKREYETPVTYWMPFNGGIGFHDATWQSSFGGTRYLTHGSHGCVNLPKSVAASLYTYVYAGMPVICYK